MRFRRNIERIGEIMAYEMSKELHYKEINIQTPLGIKKTTEISDQLVISSVLRAGLPLHMGFLNYFDQAENGFVSVRYHPNNDDYFEIKVDYQAADFNNKYLLIVDPMLATGQSIVAVYNQLMERGTRNHIAVVIAAPEESLISSNIYQIIATYGLLILMRINEHNYIIPGLGDAGDLAYGTKL
jgi:uracil phosphoribosyltransferase